MATSEAHNAATSRRTDVHAPLRGLAREKSANLAQARRVRAPHRKERCRLARRFVVQPACARGSPSQGCGKMATSEARDAATSRRTDVHAALRGLAREKSANLAQARRVRAPHRKERCRLARRFVGQPACARGSPSQGCGKMATSEAHNAATSRRTDVHAALRGLAREKSANLAQARRVRAPHRKERCRLARRFVVQPACARGSPSQGCGKMATSEARDAATSQRTDVHAPLRGLAASLRKGVDRADEAVLY